MQALHSCFLSNITVMFVLYVRFRKFWFRLPSADACFLSCSCIQNVNSWGVTRFALHFLYCKCVSIRVLHFIEQKYILLKGVYKRFCTFSNCIWCLLLPSKNFNLICQNLHKSSWMETDLIPCSVCLLLCGPFSLETNPMLSVEQGGVYLIWCFSSGTILRVIYSELHTQKKHSDSIYINPTVRLLTKKIVTIPKECILNWVSVIQSSRLFSDNFIFEINIIIIIWISGVLICLNETIHLFILLTEGQFSVRFCFVFFWFGLFHSFSPSPYLTLYKPAQLCQFKLH